MRSNHLIADVADDKTELLQCGDVAAVEHVWKKTTNTVESAGLCDAVSGAEMLPTHHWPPHPKWKVCPAINHQSILQLCQLGAR